MDYENLIPPFHLVDECGLFRLLALNRAFVSQAWRFFFFKYESQYDFYPASLPKVHDFQMIAFGINPRLFPGFASYCLNELRKKEFANDTSCLLPR